MILWAALMMAGVALVACSGVGGQPSDQQIESQVRQQVSQASDIWDVANLHKTNGVHNQDGTYTAKVAYDLVFRMSYEDAVAHVQKTQGNAGLMQVVQPLVQKYGWWKKGFTVHVDDSVTFTKSEKGWIIADEP